MFLDDFVPGLYLKKYMVSGGYNDCGVTGKRVILRASSFRDSGGLFKDPFTAGVFIRKAMGREDLRRLIYYNEKRRSLEQQKEQLRASVTSCTQRLTGMPSGSADYDRLAAYVARLSELEERYAALLIRLADERLHLESALASLPAQQERVLRLRYLEGFSWRRIAYRTHYDERHLRRIHDAALVRLEGF